MDTQEILKIVDSLQASSSTGIIVLGYYLIVYWQKIKDGLGLFQSNKANLTRTKQSYELLKLRIEIEKIKKDSNLDKTLLDKLEKEMLDNLKIKQTASFTNLQKFIAIPFIILIIVQTGVEIQAIDQNSIDPASTIFLGAASLIILTLIGFWAIPILQKQKDGLLKKSGFIIFWSFIIYLVIGTLMDTILSELFDTPNSLDDYYGVIFMSSFIISLLLSKFKKLPLMHSSSQ